MRDLPLVAGVLAMLGSALCVPPVVAQGTPDGSYALRKQACDREGSLQGNLSGDALARFISACMASGTSTPGASTGAMAARRQQCREVGEFRRGLTGDQLAAFTKQCMGE